MFFRSVFLTAAIGAMALCMAVQPAPGAGQVAKKGSKSVKSKIGKQMVNPPNFNYQVSFSKDYTVKPTPQGFKTGISAFTQASTFWQSDGKGNVTIPTLTVDKSQSWVYDWVFQPKKIGATPTTVANLLAHEQVHFDLTALAVREFMSQAQGLKDPQVKKLWGEFMTRLHTLDDLYESSTQKGVNLANQNLWVQQINTLKSRADGTFTALEQWAKRF
jgi:hypothetical protein